MNAMTGLSRHFVLLAPLALAAWSACSSPADPAPAAPMAGATCATAAAKTCGLSAGQAAVLTCHSGFWQPLTLCSPGLVCDSKMLTCVVAAGGTDAQADADDAMADSATGADTESDAQEPESAPMDAGFQLAVEHPPQPEDDPFAQPGAGILMVALERPYESVATSSHSGPLPDAADLQYTCTGQGTCTGKLGPLDFGCLAPNACPGLVFRTQQQFRFEVWHKDPKTAQADTLLGRGRTVPLGSAVQDGPTVHAYVTRPNRFAPAVSTGAGLGSARAGASAVSLPGNPAVVVVVGGATPAPGAKKAFGPDGYSAFSGAVSTYSVNTRAIQLAKSAGTSSTLATPRAFHASATGKNGILVAGGYVAGAKGPELTNTVEYLDKDLTAHVSAGTIPHLKFARAGASAVQLFPSDDFFLVVGGQGDTPCSDGQGQPLDCAGNTWELWHPVEGNLAQGRLSTPRWNHATVTIPGIGGGYVVLMGGENDSKVHDTFEVVQYTSAGGGVISDVGQDCRSDLFAGDCNAFLWEPLVQGMPAKRTLAGAAYVSAGSGTSYAWRLMAIAGGFADAAHSEPLASFDLFDVGVGNWTTTQGYPLTSARGAPLVAYAQVHGKAGKLLVASGIGSAGQTLATAEVVRIANPDQGGGTPLLPLALPTANPLPQGARVLGNALALPTGAVLLLGGLSGGANGLSGTGDADLWLPAD